MPIPYLDLQDLFVNQIAGGMTPFLFISVIVLTIILAKFGALNNITMMMIFVFFIIISPFAPVVLALTLFGIGIYFALSMNKVVSAS